MFGKSLIAHQSLACNRYFMQLLIRTIAVAGCGVFVGLLGVAYYAEIHHLVYFIMIQIFVGIFEVSASLN